MKKKILIDGAAMRLISGKGLSRSAVVVGMIICSFTRGRGGCFFGTRDYLARECGVSVRTVQRSISALIKEGLIERTREGLCATEYLLTGEKRGEESTAPEKANMREGGEDELASAENKPCRGECTSQIQEKEPLPWGFGEHGANDEGFSGEEDRELAKDAPEDAEGYERLSGMPLNYAFDSDKRDVKYRVLELGRRGYVQMTPRQYAYLLSLVPPEVLTGYIERFETMLDGNLSRGRNAPSPHSHYHTIKKWIRADMSV